MKLSYKCNGEIINLNDKKHALLKSIVMFLLYADKHTLAFDALLIAINDYRRNETRANMPVCPIEMSELRYTIEIKYGALFDTSLDSVSLYRGIINDIYAHALK